MSVDLSCGNCGATFSLDLSSDYEEGIWSLINRFCNAHVVCGYVTPVGQDDSEKDLKTANIPVKRVTKRVLKSTDLVSEDDSE